MSQIEQADAPGDVRSKNTAPSQADKILTMSPEAEVFLSDLARRAGRKEGDVIRLALGMFKTALEAKEQGKHVGVADSADALDLEMVGF